LKFCPVGGGWAFIRLTVAEIYIKVKKYLIGASELIGLITKSAKFFITGTQLIFKHYMQLI